MPEHLRFLHCADLHLGAAFSGLNRRMPELDGYLSGIINSAWHRTVRKAVEEKVDLLLIAGDSFDRNAPSLKGRIEFIKGLDELRRHNIQVCLTTGNHDPFPAAWPEGMELPDNVIFFPPGEVKLHKVIRNGRCIAGIGGIGHGSLHDLENLALKTGRELEKLPGIKIALVHANVDADRHAAPVTSEELNSCKVHYWALGHKHLGRIVYNKSYMVYSGCIQGQNVYESGEHGCFLAACSSAADWQLTFHPTSEMIFETVILDAGEICTVQEAAEKAAEKIKELKGERPLLFRLKITGSTPADAELRKVSGEVLRKVFQAELGSLKEECFLEDIILLTTPPGKEEQIREFSDFLRQEKILEKLYEELRSGCPELPAIRREHFEELQLECAVYAGYPELTAGFAGSRSELAERYKEFSSSDRDLQAASGNSAEYFKLIRQAADPDVQNPQELELKAAGIADLPDTALLLNIREQLRGEMRICAEKHLLYTAVRLLTENGYAFNVKQES